MCAEIGKGRSAVKAMVTETTPAASAVSSAAAVVESFISLNTHTPSSLVLGGLWHKQKRENCPTSTTPTFTFLTPHQTESLHSSNASLNRK
jgi:hypothetical protein